MWNAAFNKECFILMDYHLFITKQNLCLAFGYDEQVVMLMGVQFFTNGIRIIAIKGVAKLIN